MIKKPPSEKLMSPFQRIVESCPEKMDKYLELYSPLDHKGRYLHFDALRYRFPADLDPTIAWAVVKMARNRELRSIYDLGEPQQPFRFLLTPTIQKAISEVDRNTTNASLEWMCSKIGEQHHIQYLLNDLIEDEAISSSQLEGAATTTRVAKDLLKRKRKPRTADEKMILGNFKMMKFAWENRHKDLSTDLMLEMHLTGVEGIENEKYRPGVFRSSNDVEVEDADGNTVHVPPTHKGLTKRLKNLSKWVNDSHHDINTNEYFHPVVKAIALHFAVGYEHPFYDGNGRVARSLFYWYMFKNDYAAFRYIAISVLLKSAPTKYGHSYLYTETDELDLTYFIDYQCHIVLRAIEEFKKSYEKTLRDIEQFDSWLWKSGLIKKLTDKQQIVFQVAKNGVADAFTAVNVKQNLGCSYNTASKVLNGLVNMKLFKKEKQGREWVYSVLSKEKILENWNGS